jgi:hypothetical protein
MFLFYQCVIFQNEICYNLGSAKKDKMRFYPSDKQCKEYLILFFCAKLLFFLSPKYNVFSSENLQNGRVQHYLRHGIFSDFFEIFIFEFFRFKRRRKRSRLPGARAPFGVILFGERLLWWFASVMLLFYFISRIASHVMLLRFLDLLIVWLLAGSSIIIGPCMC